MNFIIQDQHSGNTLYGRVLLKEIVRTGRSAKTNVYRVPAELWVAFLQVHYSSVPEVRAYLHSLKTEGHGHYKEQAMLEAIDQRIEIPEETFREAIKRCKDLLAGNE